MRTSGSGCLSSVTNRRQGEKTPPVASAGRRHDCARAPEGMCFPSLRKALSLQRYTAQSVRGCPAVWPHLRRYRPGVTYNDQQKETTMQENRGPFAQGGANTAYARYFVGNSYLNMLSTEGVVIGNVTFEPGCRNNWHIHEAASGGGQILLCTSGRGWYQEWGKPARELHAGDVVHIPAGVKHWHGAARDSWFVHLAVEVPGEGCRSQWLEPVSEEEYARLP